MSYWNQKIELQCLVIFKRLEKENFQRGKQMKLCKILSEEAGLSKENLSAKICNYKSVAGVNNASNASNATKDSYRKYQNYSIGELEKVISML